MMKINRGSYQAIEKVNKKSNNIPVGYNQYVSSKENQRKVNTNVDNSVNLGNYNIMNSNSSVPSNMGKNQMREMRDQDINLGNVLKSNKSSSN